MLSFRNQSLTKPSLLLSITQGPPTSPVVEIVMRQRGVIERTVYHRQIILHAIHAPELRQTYDRYIVTRRSLDRIVQAMLLCTDAERKAQMHHTVMDMTERKETLERKLAASIPEFSRQLTAQAPQLHDVTARLERGEVLILFAKYNHISQDPTRPGREGESQSPTYTAFVLVKKVRR